MDTTFIDKATIVTADWLNAVNTTVYDVLGGAVTALEARTALDVPQETLEIVPQVRVAGSWVPLSGTDTQLHAATHETGGADGIDHDKLLNSAGVKHIDHSAVSILPGSGMTGGGTIDNDRTLAFSYTLEQNLNAGTFQIQNMTVPTNDDDAANKLYVDSHLSSATSVLNVAGIPTSAAGLASGDVWMDAADNNTLKVV